MMLAQVARRNNCFTYDTILDIERRDDLSFLVRLCVERQGRVHQGIILVPGKNKMTTLLGVVRCDINGAGKTMPTQTRP